MAGKARSAAGDWAEATRLILDALDIRAEYEALGVQIGENVTPRASGWLDCHCYGREDRTPSAGVNVGDQYPQRGRYKEFSGDGQNLSLFEFAAHVGKFPNWKEARAHYAAQVRVALPESVQKSPDDSLTWRDYCRPIVESWCTKKPGLSEPSVRAAGAKVADWPKSKKYSVICLPVFGEQLLDDSPVGYVVWNLTGKDLPLFQGKGNPPKPVKMLTTGGSKSGLLGKFAISHLATADVVWKTEGPTDMVALQAIIGRDDPENVKKHVVITNAGGTSEQPREAIVSLLAAKKVYVIHDADTPGQKGGRRWAEAIARHAEEVRFLQLPYDVAPNHGKDLRDWIGEGHKYHDLMYLADAAEIITKPEGPPEEEAPAAPGDKTATLREQEIMDDLQLDVLGETEDGKIKVFSEWHRKSNLISDVSRMKYQRLLQIGGPPVKMHVHQGMNSAEGLHKFSEVRDAIAMLGGFRRIDDDSEAGPGCWEGMNDNGQPDDSVILVGAGEAARWNGDSILHRILKPRIGGRLLELSSSDPWYSYPTLKQYLEGYTPQFAEKALSDAHGLFSRWRWRHQEQAPDIITGLVLATWIQTIWNWRPQVAIVGKSNSGKTTLFTALESVFGHLVIKSSQSSAAGLRQGIRKSAVAALMDEFESGKHRADVLEMLRASGRGDKVLRGTSGHKGQEFTLRHIVWVAAIESGLRREPDRNRFITLELVQPEDAEKGKLILPPPAVLTDLGQRLLAVAVKNAIEAKRMAVALKSRRFPGVHDRVVESFSVPAAILAITGGLDDFGASELLRRMLKAVDVDEIEGGDEHSLISDILDSRVDIGRGERQTVAQILAIRNHAMGAAECLEACGIAVRQDDENSGDDGLFVAHRQATRQLLRGTPWEHQNIDQILKRIPGALKIKKRIAGIRPWGILIPMTWIRENTGLGASSGDF